MRPFRALVGSLLFSLATTAAPAAVNVNFENYSVGPVSGSSPDSWIKISGTDYAVTDVNPIAGTKSINLLGSASGESRTLLDFSDLTGVVHADFRVRPGVNGTSTPRVFFQLSDVQGWPGVGVYFDTWNGAPLFGYHDDNNFTYVPNGYVYGNDHLVSIDVDPVTDTYDMTVTDLTTSQTVISFTGNGTRTTQFANVSVLDIYVLNEVSDTMIDNINIGVVPEPASLAALGLMGCIALRRRTA